MSESSTTTVVERADAARNRQLLLNTVREMITETGVEQVAVDGLAERAGLGKGTVFRRFRSRAGIFHALLDDDERAFRERVLYGPPPLGPGAMPATRLVAYGRARIRFLLERHAVARAALDHNQSILAGESTLSQTHLRMLLGQAGVDAPDVDSLALQLTGALEGPILLYLPMPPRPDSARHIARLADSWQILIEHLCQPTPERKPETDRKE
ncbi:TetR/AcrR family transcriptional regulator [Streptomyces shenzhenensis]|uniref:TetR/AcrR family transcriptional regulator n=1 Tax=Streptomyces shenzhenensis TaxID=943815 RepID=UPI003691CB47